MQSAAAPHPDDAVTEDMAFDTFKQDVASGALADGTVAAVWRQQLVFWTWPTLVLNRKWHLGIAIANAFMATVSNGAL